MKLSELKRKTRKVHVEYQGDVLNVEYRANVVTPEFVSELQDIDDLDIKITRQLEEAVVTWDLLDDEGNAIPPSLELVKQTPRPLWVAVLEAITDDMGVPAESKNG